MAIPSAKYAVDYTDGLGLKWSKQIKTIYTTLGDVDLSAAISSLNDNLAKTVYRKSRIFNPIYDNAITYASVGHDSLVMKYFARNGYPTEDITSGTVIVNYASPDGQSYATGVNEDASVPYNGGLGDARVLTDVEYNKMLFKVTIREMSLNTSNVPIPNVNYNDPTYTDVELKDIDDDKWYALFYHSGAKVWDGSSWVDSNLAPVMICSGTSVQSFQGGGSAFNNLFNNYNGTMGSGQNIEFSNTASNYYWTAHNFVNRMNIENYSMGWSDNYDYKPSYADDFDSMKAFMLNYLTENSYSPWQSVWFQLCREVHQISNDMSILLTVMCYACLDGNNNLYINWDNIYTFPIIKGSSVSKFLAGHGLYYLTDSSADLTGITPDTLHNSSAIWVGEMSSDGTTTGRWIKGADIQNYTGYNKDGNINNPDFDPSGGGGSTDPFDVDPETYGWSGGEVSGMVKYYLLTSGEMSQLQTAIASNANWTIDYLNCIVSCFVVPNSGIFFDAPIPTTVKFVLDNATQWDTGVSCSRIQGTKNKSGGTIEIPRLTKTFYDFEPYSDYSVYIPFCGRIPIKGNLCLGREIKVTYYPDVPTCSLTAVVSCGGATIAIAKGSFGTMTPVTSNGSDRKTAAVIGDVAPIITGIGTGIVGVALGNPLIVGAGAAQALGGIMGGVKESVQSYAYSVGSTGDSSFFGAGNRCYYYANYPLIDEVVNDSMFGHSVGYLCNRVGKLSGFTGFTICANPHVTFSASAEEREEIEKLLSMGVIL